MKSFRLFAIVLLIAAPAVLRAAHFERSLAPMGALALFCGARFRNRWLALGIPIASAILGDVLIGITRHNAALYTFHRLLFVVYGCYALDVLMGIGLRRLWDRISAVPAAERGLPPMGVASELRAPSALWTRVVPIAGATLTGSIFFFLATNFADWYLFDTYAKSWRGLIDCYVAAIPFFRDGTLVADVCGSALLFGGAYLLELRGAEQPETQRL